ncbi:hypothetical protein GCM10029978_051150 [Actinoallomurus acanthiterrae]
MQFRVASVIDAPESRPSALGLEVDDRGHDWTLVRLGLPGVIRGVVIDTAWFKGNFPAHASVEACAAEGYPSVEELMAVDWVEIVPRSALTGGVGRLRLWGELTEDGEQALRDRWDSLNG